MDNILLFVAGAVIAGALLLPLVGWASDCMNKWLKEDK